MLLKTIIAILVFAGLLVAQAAPLARPKVNGLEARKTRDIASELQRAQAEQKSAVKQAERSNDALAKMQVALTANKEAKQSKPLQQRLDQAKQRQQQDQRRADQANKRVPQLQAQLATWEASTLKTHKADPKKFKVDWAKGEIVPQ
jgi:vacuolar-type H+-ATPase subunit I/STV1